ncbi:hypothetical protein KUV51_21185 [Tateyamaria omphalii]|uniref:hypothetical protein n=1 Tax=Tateyamaria omphalii TaxID=299262 RepID=UPI001C991C4D|nr:hypothetical protein [Tateyamaria omphalii]MBY5935536.1 hypothetical protein [Tateyamaria omphalii]
MKLAFTGLTLATPLWSTAATGMGARAAADIGVRCTGAGDAALHMALCDRLRTELALRLPARRVSNGPGTTTVTLHLDQATDTALIGHLAWAGQQTGTGPSVTAGTRDSTITSRQYDMLISALLKITDLPL